MNKISIILTFSFTQLFVFAQDYISFPLQNAIWQINTVGMSSNIPLNPFGLGGDTIIGSLSYKKIVQSNDSTMNFINNSTYYSAVREDSKKWYFIRQGDVQEYLLYDYNLDLNDTIHISNPYIGSEIDFTISQIDSIELLGVFHKRFKIVGLEQAFGWSEYWIEGIGSTSGLFYSGTQTIDFGYYLVCFHKDEDLIYMNSNESSCYIKDLGLTKNTDKIKSIEVFPNPATDQLTIQNEDFTNQELIFKVYSLLGEVILLNEIIEGKIKQIDISNLDSGLYFYEVLRAKSVIQHGNFQKN